MTCIQSFMTSTSDYSEAQATTLQKNTEKVNTNMIWIYMYIPTLILYRTYYSSVKGAHFQSGVSPSVDDTMVLKTISPGL